MTHENVFTDVIPFPRQHTVGLRALELQAQVRGGGGGGGGGEESRLRFGTLVPLTISLSSIPMNKLIIALRGTIGLAFWCSYAAVLVALVLSLWPFLCLIGKRRLFARIGTLDFNVVIAQNEEPILLRCLPSFNLFISPFFPYCILNNKLASG